MQSHLDCRKPPAELFDRGVCSLLRALLGHEVSHSHTRSLSSIFDHVHAAVKNDFDFVFRCGGKFCEAFSVS